MSEQEPITPEEIAGTLRMIGGGKRLQVIPGGTVRTASGAAADWNTPAPLEDYLLQLGRIPRFTGATVVPWTVLEHSYHTYLIAQSLYPEQALQALLHDFAEILIGDIPTPTKVRAYSVYERRHVELAAASFGLDLDWGEKTWARVKRCDDHATAVEGYHMTRDTGWPEVEWGHLRKAMGTHHKWMGGQLRHYIRGIIEEARG